MKNWHENLRARSCLDFAILWLKGLKTPFRQNIGALGWSVIDYNWLTNGKVRAF